MTMALKEITGRSLRKKAVPRVAVGAAEIMEGIAIIERMIMRMMPMMMMKRKRMMVKMMRKKRKKEKKLGEI
jgi:hypothetical protein